MGYHATYVISLTQRVAPLRLAVIPGCVSQAVKTGKGEAVGLLIKVVLITIVRGHGHKNVLYCKIYK